MKFTSKFLTLLSATAALSLPLEKRDTIIEVSSGCARAIDNLYSKYEKGCNVIKAKVVEGSMLDDVCNSYSAKACNDLKAVKIRELPECRGDNPLKLNDLEFTKKVFTINLKLKCTKNENNKYCPLSYSYTFVTDNQIQEACNSEKCSSATIKYYDEIAEEFESYLDVLGDRNRDVGYDIKKLVNIQNYLKSDKCALYSKPTTTTTTTTKPKPKPTTTTTTTTKPKPKPTTTTTTTTVVVPEPTTTTTTTVVVPKPTTPGGLSAPSDSEDEPEKTEKTEKTQKRRKCIVKSN